MLANKIKTETQVESKTEPKSDNKVKVSNGLFKDLKVIKDGRYIDSDTVYETESGDVVVGIVEGNIETMPLTLTLDDFILVGTADFPVYTYHLEEYDIVMVANSSRLKCSARDIYDMAVGGQPIFYTGNEEYVGYWGCTNGKTNVIKYKSCVGSMLIMGVGLGDLSTAIILDTYSDAQRYVVRCHVESEFKEMLEGSFEAWKSRFYDQDSIMLNTMKTASEEVKLEYAARGDKLKMESQSRGDVKAVVDSIIKVIK